MFKVIDESLYDNHWVYNLSLYLCFDIVYFLCLHTEIQIFDLHLCKYLIKL